MEGKKHSTVACFATSRHDLHVPALDLRRLFFTCALSLIAFAAVCAQSSSEDYDIFLTSHNFVHSLYFRLDNDVVDENYMTNRQTLNDFRFMVDSVGLEHIDSIKIVVQSSPEGRAWYNINLSKRRAASTEAYFAQHFPDLLPKTTIIPDGESWNALRQYLLHDTHLTKKQIQQAVKIIDSNPNSDQRKKVFQQLSFYPYLHKTYYPRLRNTLMVTVFSSPNVGRKTKYSEPEPVVVAPVVVHAPVVHVVDTIRDTTYVHSVVHDTTYVYNTIIVNNTMENTVPPVETDWTAKDSLPRHPVMAIKTNLLYDAVTFVNMELEWPFKKHYSLMLEVTYPWWLDREHNRWCFQIGEAGLEWRYWFSDWRRHGSYMLWDEEDSWPLKGWFIGLYGAVAYYDWQPWQMNGWQGELASAGLSFGYSKNLGKNWRMEFSLGIGYVYTQYRSYHVDENTPVEPDRDQHLWREPGPDVVKQIGGPTKLKMSIGYLINAKCKERKKHCADAWGWDKEDASVAPDTDTTPQSENTASATEQTEKGGDL